MKQNSYYVYFGEETIPYHVRAFTKDEAEILAISDRIKNGLPDNIRRIVEGAN